MRAEGSAGQKRVPLSIYDKWDDDSKMEFMKDNNYNELMRMSMSYNRSIICFQLTAMQSIRNNVKTRSYI